MSVREEEFFCLERFQLENLISNSVSFLFFNLSPDFASLSLSDSALELLNLSKLKTKEEIKKFCKKQDKSRPIVLICENGSESKLLAQFLQKEGFINVFFLKEGIISLTEYKK